MLQIRNIIKQSIWKGKKMAYVPKCISCKQFNFEKMSCEIHSNGIPKDIMNEVKTCEHYSPEKVKSEDDLPIAKGR